MFSTLILLASYLLL